MKCLWKKCGGQINFQTGRCFKCARTRNIPLEEENDRKKALVKTDYQTNSTDSERKSRLRRKYA